MHKVLQTFTDERRRSARLVKVESPRVRQPGASARAMVCLAIVLLIGCAVERELYPTNWPKIEQDVGKDCSRISGTYSTRSSDVAGSSNPPALAIAIWNLNSKAQAVPYSWLDKFDQVRLEIAFPNARATFISTSTQPYVLDIDQHRYKIACSGHALTLRRVVGGIDLFTAAAGREGVSFLKAGDGSLVMEMTRKEIGVLFVVPVGGATSSWARFAAIQP